MKTELKILTLFLVSLAIILLVGLYNCGHESTLCDNYPDGIVKTYYHFEEDTSKIPYHGFDTLSFLKITPSDTDTVIFYGQGKKYYEIVETDYDIDGCQHDDIYDAYDITFIDNISSENIIFKLFVEGNGGADMEIMYKDRRFLESLLFIDLPSMSEFMQIYKIYGMTFYRVSKIFPRGNGNTYDLSKKDTQYFNKYDGIVRIAYDSSTFSMTLLK